MTTRTEERPMADLPRYPGTPRWVKVFGIVVLVLVALFAILHVEGHGLSDQASFGGHTAPGSGRR
jgi:hypothetical protein